MNIPKQKCPCCGEGELQLVRRPYIADLGNGEQISVPDVEMEVCDKCDEEILSLDAARHVDSVIAREIDKLETSEIQEIREFFGVDQTRMGEVLGLGGKTYHRWEKGSQYPSRSMGYYLRILRNFPDVFYWLKDRGWLPKNRVVENRTLQSIDVSSRFPKLANNPTRLNTLMSERRNYALIFFENK